MLNKYKKIMDKLQWKYFVGQYKPNDKKKMEKLFKGVSKADKDALKEMKILLNSMEADSELKEDLGVNPYNLYPNGLQTIVNFKNISSLVTYKVNDLTQTSQLFGNKTYKGVKKYTADKIEKIIEERLVDNKIYLSNFDKAFTLFTLPESISEKDVDVKKIAKANELTDVRFIKETNTYVIKVK